ncbi:hypothetical protein SAMN05660652_03684 [Propionivibrio dicarboxylicus]|uniref:Uncharacterized protein n=1 Tax=Propionivibrio dicarboxylicus TaxID=83767 RepID=A0A1G8LQZ0_9RHOO|nr:hypothetical protein SAMN05660652_03684 [Propionivibrio dicarboxylicus]
MHVTMRGGNRNPQPSWLEAYSPAHLQHLIGETIASATADAVFDIVIGHSERTIIHNGTVRLPPQIERGLGGLVLRHGGKCSRICPLTMLAENWSFPQAFATLMNGNDIGIQPTDRNVIPYDIGSFSTVQFQVSSQSTAFKVVHVFRGKPVVPIEHVNQHGTERLALGMADWMRQHVADTGKLTYCYHPKANHYARNSNRIREFMGSIALFKAARHFDDNTMFALAERSLRYNLDAYLREEQDYGVIVEGEKIKLGAAALAAMAIRHSERRADYANCLRRLTAFTEMMWQTSGAFRCFLRPADRADICQNFYPGETLLLWAGCWLESRDTALWQKIEASFRHYRQWHAAQPNPAFVPWHTQAYYLLWQATGDSRFKDAILEMNDWLLPFQQWETVADYPDTQGRFYDPDLPYGPPHASSTGVYLEGLIDAFRLATAIGDTDRAHRYAETIKRGVRNIMQLQYSERDECAGFPAPEKALGGIRTTEYNNLIRIDNVQHALMAVIRILKTDDFLWDR